MSEWTGMQVDWAVLTPYPLGGARGTPAAHSRRAPPLGSWPPIRPFASLLPILPSPDRIVKIDLTDGTAGARLPAMTDDPLSALYPGLFSDLVGGTLLRLEEGERLWKLYFLRPSWGRDERIEHRIYTKLQADGKLGLVSYSFRMPPGQRPSKSDVAYARDIPEDTLNEIIWNVVRKSEIGPEELEVIDLSGHPSFEIQLRQLRGLAQQAGEGS